MGGRKVVESDSDERLGHKTKKAAWMAAALSHAPLLETNHSTYYQNVKETVHLVPSRILCKFEKGPFPQEAGLRDLDALPPGSRERKKGIEMGAFSREL